MQPVDRRPDPGAQELATASFTVGADEYVVISYPAGEPDPWASLTPAERAVACMLVSGLGNREIARARARSLRTVANQVAAIYRKLGVASRAELVARAL